jgi:hypothetical protein
MDQPLEATKSHSAPSQPRTGDVSRGLRNGNPAGPWFGPDWPGQRCLARLRGKPGRLCQRAALKGKKRCSLHGGRSTGPRTEAGIEAIRRSRTKHGERSAAAVASRRASRLNIARCKRLLALLDRLANEGRRHPSLDEIEAADIPIDWFCTLMRSASSR